jgi:hypothetical protein
LSIKDFVFYPMVDPKDQHNLSTRRYNTRAITKRPEIAITFNVKYTARRF